MGGGLFFFFLNQCSEFRKMKEKRLKIDEKSHIIPLNLPTKFQPQLSVLISQQLFHTNPKGAEVVPSI